jgi:hypothetical protein
MRSMRVGRTLDRMSRQSTRSSLRLARMRPLVLVCCDDQEMRQAVVARASDRARESWDGSRAQFLASLDPGSRHDWLRATVGEPPPDGIRSDEPRAAARVGCALALDTSLGPDAWP